MYTRLSSNEHEPHDSNSQFIPFVFAFQAIYIAFLRDFGISEQDMEKSRVIFLKI